MRHSGGNCACHAAEKQDMSGIGGVLPVRRPDANKRPLSLLRGKRGRFRIFDGKRIYADVCSASSLGRSVISTTPRERRTMPSLWK